MPPLHVLHLHLETLGAVVRWPVFSEAALAALLAAIAAGELGPVSVVVQEQQLAA